MAVNEKETVYWALLEHDPWHLYLAATTRGLCYVGSQDAPFGELEDWVRKKIPQSELIENKEAIRPYESELVQYLDGQRKQFEMPLDLRGTEFQIKVWGELLRVPFGQAATYTDIAERI